MPAAQVPKCVRGCKLSSVLRFSTGCRPDDLPRTRFEKQATILFGILVLVILALYAAELVHAELAGPVSVSRVLAFVCASCGAATLAALLHQIVRRKHSLCRWTCAISLVIFTCTHFAVSTAATPYRVGLPLRWLPLSTTFLLASGAPARRVTLLFVFNHFALATLCTYAAVGIDLRLTVSVRSIPGTVLSALQLLLGHLVPHAVTFFLLRGFVQQRRAAETVDRERTAFVCRMSHEMRTPLNGILPLLGELETSVLNSDQHELVRVIKHSGNILLNLVEDILDFSKLQGRHMTLSSVSFDLRQCLMSVCAIFTDECRGHVTLNFDIDPLVNSEAIGDPLRLSQVLINLIRNALKFVSRTSGVVSCTVSCECVTDEIQTVIFRVEDNGIGISEEDQRLLFTPFYQVPNGRLNEKGTGLGLCISRDLVHQMGGKMRLQSAIGKGTLVEFCIPFRRPNRHSSSSSSVDYSNVVRSSGSISEPLGIARSPRTSRLPGPVDIGSFPRFLVVDDNPVNCLVLRRVLTAAFRCTIHTVMDGAAALTEMRREAFHVVFVDVHMPRVDGIEVTRVGLQEHEISHANTTAPIFLGVTADATPSVHERCIAAGMSTVLIKPLVPRDLTTHLLEACPTLLSFAKHLVPTTLNPLSGVVREAATIIPHHTALPIAPLQVGRTSLTAESPMDSSTDTESSLQALRSEERKGSLLPSAVSFPSILSSAPFL